jgi:hypothetical protein
MPLISLRGSASAVSFGFLSAQSKLYWVGLVGGAVTTRGFTGAYDSTGAFIAGGETYNGTNYIGLILKFGPTGSVMWQKQAPDVATKTNANVASLAVGADDTIYVGVQTYTGFSDFAGYRLICDTEGENVSFGLRIRSTSTTPTCQSIFPPNTDAAIQVSGGSAVDFLKEGVLASSERQLSSRAIRSGVFLGGTSSFLGGSVTATGNPWVVGYSTSGVSYALRVDAGSGKDRVYAVATYGANNYAGFKYESAAAITRFGDGGWSRRLEINTPISGLCVDAAGFIYACTFAGGVFKYSASGVLQWQRVFSCAGGTVTLRSIAIDSAGVLGVVGNVSVSGAFQMFVSRVPDTGGATNTITVGGLDISYAASAYAENTGDVAWVSDSPSTPVNSYTAGNSGFTEDSAATVEVVRL